MMRSGPNALSAQLEANPASSGNSLLCFEPLLLKTKPCEHLSCYTIVLYQMGEYLALTGVKGS